MVKEKKVISALDLETNLIEHRAFLLRNIKVISEILNAIYQSPNHGNKPNPIDELIYIHLSKKTNEKGYTKAYENLANEYPGWKGLAKAKPEHIRKLIESAGLGSQRTKELLTNIKTIRNKFGNETRS